LFKNFFVYREICIKNENRQGVLMMSYALNIQQKKKLNASELS
jgi:hypothetical protein